MKYFTWLVVLTYCVTSTYLTAQSSVATLPALLDQYRTEAFDPMDQVQIKNLESINTSGIDYSPVYHNRGIVFSSNRPKKKGWLRKAFFNGNSNLFFTAANENGKYFEPIVLPGKINTLRHEGGATFSPEHDMMIYTKNCDKANSLGYYELKLSSAIFEKGKWEELDDLPFNQEYRTCHPALSPEGNMLLFSAERPDGFGGMDLYASMYNNGEWSAPYNLGQEVNTAGDEVFPYIGPDGALYFSSNGHPGMGGLDLFYATQNNDCDWSQIQRFNEPFNTRWDDFGFVSNGELNAGFFSSNRPGGLGSDDIYTWQITEPLEIEPVDSAPQLLLTGVSIADENTGLPLNEVALTLIEINTSLLQTGYLEEPVTIVNHLNQTVLSLLGKVIEPTQTPESYASYPIEADKTYLVLANRPERKPLQQIVSADQLLATPVYAMVWPANNSGTEIQENSYATEEEEITPPNTPIIEEVVVGGITMLDPISYSNEVLPERTKATEIFTSREIPAHLLTNAEAPKLELVDLPVSNKVISFSPIYHEFNKHAISGEEAGVIDDIVWQMNMDVSIHLTILSHTDSRGSTAYNLKLSQQRAEAVFQQLTKRGISPQRLTAKGMGESELINDCGNSKPCEEEEHQINRRTEFLIR